MQATLSIGKVIAELDPTTMKRIAKYNLEKEFEEQVNKVRNMSEEVRLLEKEYGEMEKKLNFARYMCKKIWADEDFDEGKYLPKYDDYEEDDEE